MRCFIVFNSITYAQTASHILNKKSFTCNVIRTPQAVGYASCSYSVVVSSDNLVRAMSTLNDNHIVPIGCFAQNASGDYGEVRM